MIDLPLVSQLTALVFALSVPKANAKEPPVPDHSPAGAATEPEPLAEAPPALVPASAPEAVGVAPAAAGPLHLDGPGGLSIRFGLLVQPQWQAVSSPTLDGYAENLFIHRTRFIVGGTLFDKIEFFLDTDYPNLFLPANAAPANAPDNFVKSTPGMNIQDVFVTYKALDNLVKVDVGYMLPPMGHNAVQGAATLFGSDYFAYSFQHGALMGSSANPFGRDVGLQLRGLLVGGLIEYRLGVFQGLRHNRTGGELEARNFFRVAGRVQVNLLDPEPGFFYAGTYLGTKKIASVGAAFDIQSSYRYFAFDGLVDMPLGPGVATAQVNLAHWNGNTFIPALLKQTALMTEAGYTLAGLGLGPILRVEELWGSGTLANQNRVGGGVAYWPYGHNVNLKLFYMHIKSDGLPRGANQFSLQAQVFFF
jgi:hypothetical protein